ncbi:MAG: helix-turn-helix transcriptional regulator [Rhizobiaceae bacterium]
MDNLKTLREAQGLTQAQLAKKAGTSQPQIRRLENGERELTRAWAERLAPHLKTTAIHIVFPEVPLTDEAEIKVSGEAGIKKLLSRIDKLPASALQPLWRSIDGYIRDAERSSPDHSQAQTEPASRPHEPEPTR